MKKFLVVFILFITCGYVWAATSFDKSSSGAVTTTTTDSYTPTVNGKWRVIAVTVHYTASTLSEPKVILDSENGATWDTVLSSGGTGAKEDFFWEPDYDFILERSDALKVLIGTADSVGYAVTVKGEYL